jgi:cytoskeletal protein CcmA (bactofilin family)
MANTTFSGPVTSVGGFIGDITGDITGDLTGNVTGDLTGNVTGDVTGNVTGDLTGNVTGDVTGNVTGDLTGDVTGDVEGAIKLPTYTVAGGTAAPSAATAGAGTMIYVSDGAAGDPIVAFSDGTNWLRVDTRAAITDS